MAVKEIDGMPVLDATTPFLFELKDGNVLRLALGDPTGYHCEIMGDHDISVGFGDAHGCRYRTWQECTHAEAMASLIEKEPVQAYDDLYERFFDVYLSGEVVFWGTEKTAKHEVAVKINRLWRVKQ